ncbi:MAG TPA: hypothetical protein VK832_07590 [Burkholderiaceae bacterium]|nr:hypothetical protein [Burkholderiaceae bacterium]
MLTIRDDARFWRSPLLTDAKTLTAEYFAQEFAPHYREVRRKNIHARFAAEVYDFDSIE